MICVESTGLTVSVNKQGANWRRKIGTFSLGAFGPRNFLKAECNNGCLSPNLQPRRKTSRFSVGNARIRSLLSQSTETLEGRNPSASVTHIYIKDGGHVDLD